MAIDTDGITLATAEGYPILDINGQKVNIPATYNSALISVDTAGNLYYPDASNNLQPIGVQIGLKNQKHLEHQDLKLQMEI